MLYNMVKNTKRKGFNFFRSYFDVYNELSDKDKIQFMDALLDRQFLGVKPTKLNGMAKFAYISQTNSIDSQVKGYEDKTGTKLQKGTVGGTVGGAVGGLSTPSLQVEEKGEVKEKDIYSAFSFLEFWNKYDNKINRSKCESKYKSISEDDRLKIKNTLDAFLKYKPFKDYTHPNPLTYLNGNRWNDEVKAEEKKEYIHPTKRLTF